MNSSYMKQIELCEALGLSKGQISKLVARGMPTSSLEAAKAWRRANLDPGRVIGHQFIRKPDAARRNRQDPPDDESRNPVDCVLVDVLPRLFFSLGRHDAGLPSIGDALRTADLVLDDDQVLLVTACLVARYRAAIKLMGIDDARLNLPDELREE